MRWVVLIIIVGLVVFASLYFWPQRANDGTEKQKNIKTEEQENMGNLKLTSSVFLHNEKIPAKYTCDGEDVSPLLAISGVPERAKSLVFIMDDPDAPVGTWDHWIVFNIPPDIEEIAEGQEPRGIHGKGTSGNLEYKGPCPPDREHRYFFKLYALDAELDLKEGVTKTEVERAMENHILDTAELIGLYERK